MQIIGSSFGRTGTTSLKKALEILGFNPCYHMIEVFKNPSHFNKWNIASNDPSNFHWDDILSNYKAVVDFPACCYYKELMNYYPNSKIILTIRDFDSWYKSASNTIYKASTSAWGPTKYIFVNNLTKMVNKIVWNGLFNGEFNNKEKTKQIYYNHIEDVKKHVPNDRLLIFSLKEGWEPLCNFLNLPIPNEPFPHVNDTEDFKKNLKTAKRLCLLSNIIIYGIILCMLLGLIYIGLVIMGNK